MRQFQVPLYSSGTKGQWLIRFDVVLADGLEAGSLRMTDVMVPAELEERVQAVLPKGLPPEMVCTLIAYYAVNKPEGSDWVVLPVASFDAHFGTTSFGRKYLRADPWGEPGAAGFRVWNLPISGTRGVSDLRTSSRPNCRERLSLIQQRKYWVGH